MPQGKKDKFTELAKKEYENWQEAMTKWEEQMIQMGNMDVIRTKVLIPKMENKK